MQYKYLGTSQLTLDEIDKRYKLRKHFGFSRKGIAQGVYGAMYHLRKRFFICDYMGELSNYYTGHTNDTFCYYIFTRNEINTLIQRCIIELNKGVTL